MFLGDVVDELHDENGFTYAGSPEEADLSALQEGFEKVDDLDPGLEHLHLGALIDQSGSIPVNRVVLGALNSALLIDGLAYDVHDPPQTRLSNRAGDRRSRIYGFHPPNQPVGRMHGDGPYTVLSKVLFNFGDDAQGLPLVPFGRDVDGVVDRRKVTLELYIHNGADDLNDLTDELFLSH